eukprot:jgi/Orpsp1_1/1188770/evm.model.d7180000067059.1
MKCLALTTYVFLTLFTIINGQVTKTKTLPNVGTTYSECPRGSVAYTQAPLNCNKSEYQITTLTGSYIKAGTKSLIPCTYHQTNCPVKVTSSTTKSTKTIPNVSVPTTEVTCPSKIVNTVTPLPCDRSEQVIQTLTSSYNKEIGPNQYTRAPCVIYKSYCANKSTTTSTTTVTKTKTIPDVAVTPIRCPKNYSMPPLNCDKSDYRTIVRTSSYVISGTKTQCTRVQTYCADKSTTTSTTTTTTSKTKTLPKLKDCTQIGVRYTKPVLNCTNRRITTRTINYPGVGTCTHAFEECVPSTSTTTSTKLPPKSTTTTTTTTSAKLPPKTTTTTTTTSNKLPPKSTTTRTSTSTSTTTKTKSLPKLKDCTQIGVSYTKPVLNCSNRRITTRTVNYPGVGTCTHAFEECVPSTSTTTTSTKLPPKSTTTTTTTTTTSAKLPPKTTTTTTTTTSTKLPPKTTTTTYVLGECKTKKLPIVNTRIPLPCNQSEYVTKTITSSYYQSNGNAIPCTYHTIGCPATTGTTTTTTTTKQPPKVVTTTTTTTSTTKLPPKIVTTTTTAPVISGTKCLPVTVTVTEKETITEKVTITMTVKEGGPSNEPVPDDKNCASKYQQCGGKNFQGPTCCQSGTKCQFISEYYYQCI